VLDEVISRGEDTAYMGNGIAQKMFPLWKNGFDAGFARIKPFILSHSPDFVGQAFTDAGGVVDSTGSLFGGINKGLTDILNAKRTLGGGGAAALKAHFAPVSLALNGLNSAISTQQFIHSMADPNSTLFSKIAHGVHLGTSLLGLIPNPITVGISFAGDMGMLGLQMNGFLNDKPAPAAPAAA
jgi:hypothetical protein